MSKNVRLGISVLVIAAVAIGAYFYIATSGDEILPRYSVHFVAPEQKVYKVGESFEVRAVVTTATPTIDEYRGTWEPPEPYQKAWTLDGTLNTGGPLVLGIAGDTVINQRLSERLEPPEQKLESSEEFVVVVTCKWVGKSVVSLSYSVNNEPRKREGEQFTCEGGGEGSQEPEGEVSGEQQLDGTVPEVKSGIEVRGLEGLKTR